MTEPRIALVACDIFRNELEYLLKDDPLIVSREYIEYALHVDPQAMKKVIIERVNTYKGKADMVLLGYSVCGSLENIENEVDVPLMKLSGADCIECLMGSEDYAKEKKICPGTYFNSPGWAEAGIEGMMKEMKFDQIPEEDGIDVKEIVGMLFDGYERVLFVDPGIGNEEFFMQRTVEFADYLNLRAERTKCTLAHMRNDIERAENKARELVSQA